MVARPYAVRPQKPRRQRVSMRLTLDEAIDLSASVTHALQLGTFQVSLASDIHEQ